jgi:hypothetical protein
MSFTNKYPLFTNLSRDISSFLLIADLLNGDSEPLLVITESSGLGVQVKRWAGSKGIKAVNLVRPPLTLKRFLKHYTPAGIANAFLSTLRFWLLSRPCRPVKSLEDDHLVIVTHTHPRCYSPDGGYRDAYFGPLVEQLNGSNQKAMILAIPVERPAEQIRRIQGVKSDIPIVPIDAYLTLGNLVLCAWQTLRLLVKPAKPKGPMEIDGFDISYLVRQAITEALQTGDIFWNIRVYYAARRLALRNRASRWLYPYENRAWEKMLLLGARSVSSRMEMVGYQHTSVTPSHTNYLFAEEDAQITPLPDIILTTGGVVERRLAEEGNYPPGIFTTACALRLGQASQDGADERRNPPVRLLVALGTGLDEYVSSVDFLEEAFKAANPYEVKIRPHPSLESLPLSPRDFYSLSNGFLADEFEWADVVLYASSTLGMEGILLGKPAIYLDLGFFLDTDPMFGWDEFKWSVKEPCEVVETLEMIAALEDTEFQRLQDRGRDYVRAYLRPVTEEALREFRSPAIQVEAYGQSY